MTVGIGTDVKNSALLGIRALIDGGAGVGLVRIYDAPRPGTGVAITTQTLLGEIELNKPSFSEPSAGSMNLLLTPNPVQEASAIAGGTALWARIVDSDGNFVMDIDVGDLASAAELKIPTTTITLGGLINVISGTISIS